MNVKILRYQDTVTVTLSEIHILRYTEIKLQIQLQIHQDTVTVTPSETHLG